jgi:hypothetical protein
MPEGPAVGRVEAERRALTMPSTAPASNTRWWNARNCGRQCDISSRKIHDAHKPIAVRFVDRLFRRIRTYERGRGRRVPPAQLECADDDNGHDQRWRERPRLDRLGSLEGQDTGVVHAIVGSPTVTSAPTETAAESAAWSRRSQQAAATSTV